MRVFAAHAAIVPDWRWLDGKGGRVRRVRDAVATGKLRPVQSFVGARKQGRRAVGFRRQRGDAQGSRDRPVTPRAGDDAGADALGEGERAALIRLLEDDGELLAPVAGDQVAVARVSAQDLRDLAQNFVSLANPNCSL